ncbi:stress response protein SCP2 [Streptomyces sp. KhCrAH-43]|uniref:TerD family protein n=1 Tax=unclassified Streptomyces TaxID=2593676 RepID=UPI000476F10D|nr:MULTISPECIES: TerD family protein [unclassified Streptomyces]MYS37440.1 hypothetical protein [Streptomyces sp. SID4920]MYX67997.1 hypothetical protein [Streptomyces sp. SID8373]RAJ56832.1 stress response protein SCP2 [Streptomyces sp. KhCrAH-43]
MSHVLDPVVIRHTLRLPAPSGPAGQGGAVARQFDSALMSVGFKLAGPVLEHLSALSPETVTETARHTLDVVREMVGDHVRHNSYFIGFPAGVPDTFDFWRQCVADALLDETARPAVIEQLSAGAVDLLTLPSYGRYQHTYDDMLAVQDELIAAAGDRTTVLHLGGSPDAEVSALYLALAGSTTPLSEEHLRDLGVLAAHCVDGEQPETVPVRENRAVVNTARLAAGRDLLLDTVTDVLRLACALSDGDVSLVEPTRFRSLSRPVRRALMAGLDAVVAAAPAKLADVPAHREAFKRLGERLHPHEYPDRPHAAAVFAVARGEKEARTFDSRVEELLAAGDIAGAARLLAAAPGKLFRSLDRLLRGCRTDGERDAVVTAAEQTAPQVSGRVLLSVREHLHNRGTEPAGRRFFVNQRARAWVTDDRRAPVPESARERLVAALDAEAARRLPGGGRLLVDPDILDVALPLSGKSATDGFGVLPRGSLSPVDGELLRFFVYWKQAKHTTDFDLSALMLDARYETVCWLSYTALTEIEGAHSGDITEAPDGASEFIDLRLGAVRGDFIVPQVNIFSGESFEAVEESFFGFMTRDADQAGRPFEPRTVRMKSELRGRGAVALPLAFLRGDDGRWRAKWLHLYLAGAPKANRVEGNRVSVAALLSGIVEREYLTVGYLTGLREGRGATVALWDGASVPDGPVTYIGLERPDGLHPDSVVVTPENLRDLIPA